MHRTTRTAYASGALVPVAKKQGLKNMPILEPEKQIAFSEAVERAPAGSFWRHMKGGGTYKVLAHGFIEATVTPAIVYRSTGTAVTVWIRPAAEFLDGRFEKINENS